MTTPSDAPILELLAACEQLAEGSARALQAVQNLTSAGFEGRGITAAELLAYREQADRAAADLERFLSKVCRNRLFEPQRALVAKFKTPVHGALM